MRLDPVADIGEDRLIYRLEAEGVKVALVGKRNDDEVYRRFRRSWSQMF